MGKKLGDLLDRNDIVYRALRGNEYFYKNNYKPGAELFIDYEGCSVFANMNREQSVVLDIIVDRVKICKKIYRLTVDLCLNTEVYPIQQGKNLDHALLLNSHISRLNGEKCHNLPISKAVFLSKNCDLIIEY